MHYAPALHASLFGYVYVLTRGSQSRDSTVMETMTWTHSHGNNNNVHTTFKFNFVTCLLLSARLALVKKQDHEVVLLLAVFSYLIH